MGKPLEMVKIRYVSDKPSVYLVKGGVYEGYRAKDDRRELFWCIHIEEDDDPGDYGFSSHLFEIVPEGEEVEILRP